jgi:molybdopterin converting factor small subunit
MNLAANRAPDQAADPPAVADAPASVVLLFFAEARVAAGTRHGDLQGRTLGEVLDVARSRYGTRFAVVLESARVWVNGEPVPSEHLLRDGDEVAVLPPVSGGAS